VTPFKITPRLIWFSLTILLFWAALYVYVPILPVYAASLQGATMGLAGLVVSMYGLSQLVLRVPLGLLSDKLHRRRIFVIIGFLLSFLAAVGLSFSKHIGGVALFRGVSGASAAMWVIISVLFTSYFPRTLTVKATSFVVFLAVFAQMISSLAGGLIADNFGNQAVFLTAASFAAIGLLFFLFIKQESAHNEVISATDDSRFKLAWPLIAVSLTAAIGQYITFATTHTYIPILADQLGASSAQLGGLTAAMQFAYMITSLLVSFFLPSRLEKWAAVLGIGIIGAASFAVLLSGNVSMIILSRLLHGIGHGLSYPVLMGLAIKQVRDHHRATAMGIFQAIYALGMFAGPAISGWVSSVAGLNAVFSSSGWLAILSLPILILGFRRKTKE